MTHQIIIDWGTTNFRAWYLDSAGQICGSRESDEGLLHCIKAGFEPVLTAHLNALYADDKTPVLISGMAGSRQGWLEAPYLPTPAPVSALADHAVRLGDVLRDIRFLPGVAQIDETNPDVMRGEETQILGLCASGMTSSVICLPGTHSKWVELKDGRIEGFSTMMTGEIFSLLSKNSILATMIDESEGVDGASPGFQRGLEQGIAQPASLSNAFFALRAGALLEQRDPEQALSTLSGLLIGSEIAYAKTMIDQTSSIQIIANNELATLYARALELVGLQTDVQNGEALTRNGLTRAARQIWD